MFLKTYPFFLGCWICWHINVHSILLQCFVFLGYQLRLLFCFLIYLLGFSILSRWVWPTACQFCLLSVSFLISSFPHSSVGKESGCSAGDPGSILELGRSAGEGISYPLQYSWASLVAQTVKNPPAMQETVFDPWDGNIPWRRERLPTPVFWPGEFHGLYGPWGCKESDLKAFLETSPAWFGESMPDFLTSLLAQV